MALSIQNRLIRDRLNEIVLKSLSLHDKEATQVVKEIEQLTSGQVLLKSATINSCIKRMEEQGLICSYMASRNNGRSKKERKMFSLTQQGKDSFAKLVTEWEYERSIADRLISDKAFNISVLPPVSKAPPRPRKPKVATIDTEQAIDLDNTDLSQKQTMPVDSVAQPNVLDTLHAQIAQYTPELDYYIDRSIFVQNHNSSSQTMQDILNQRQIGSYIDKVKTEQYTTTDWNNWSRFEDKPTLPSQQEVVQPQQEFIQSIQQESIQPAQQEIVQLRQEFIQPIQQEPVQSVQQEVVQPQQEFIQPIQQELVQSLQQEVVQPQQEFIQPIQQELVQSAQQEIVQLRQEFIQPIQQEPIQSVQQEMYSKTQSTIKKSFENNSIRKLSPKDELKQALERDYLRYLTALVIDELNTPTYHTTSDSVDTEQAHDTTNNNHLSFAIIDEYTYQASKQPSQSNPLSSAALRTNTTTQSNQTIDNQHSNNSFDTSTIRTELLQKQNLTSNQIKSVVPSKDFQLEQVWAPNKGLDIKTHNINSIKKYNQQNYYLRNQLMYKQYMILFVLAVVQIVATYLIMDVAIGVAQSFSLLYYALALVVFALFPIYAAIQKYRNPNKRSRYFNWMLFRFILAVQFVVIIVFVNAFAGMALPLDTYFATSTILPSILMINILISGFIQKYLYNSTHYSVSNQVQHNNSTKSISVNKL